MAADDGGIFWVGQPLTTCQKKSAGSRWRLMMGMCFLGGRPLTRRENIAGAVRQRRDCNDGVGNVAFNDSCINTNQLEQKREGSKIQYVDFTSLYPWVNKNGVYAMTPSCSFEDNVSRHLDIKYEEK